MTTQVNNVLSICWGHNIGSLRQIGRAASEVLLFSDFAYA